MGRVKGTNRGLVRSIVEDYDLETVEKARNIVVELTQDFTTVDVLDLFYTDNLELVEKGIKSLNQFSKKCWLLSAIALYTLIYDKELWRQSGLTWSEYSHQLSANTGLDARDITEQLAGARFFIKYHIQLLNAGWNPNVSNFNLARAELAVELSGSVDETIQHVVNDTVRDFRDWYQSFKVIPALPFEDKRPDVVIEKNGITINGINVISEGIPEQERVQLQGYLEKIYSALKNGDVPAIVPVYDEKEAKVLIRLRNRYRGNK